MWLASVLVFFIYTYVILVFAAAVRILVAADCAYGQAGHIYGGQLPVVRLSVDVILRASDVASVVLSVNVVVKVAISSSCCL